MMQHPSASLPSRDLIQITSLALRTSSLEQDLWQRPSKAQPLFLSLWIHTDVQDEASTDSLLGSSLNYGTVTKAIEKAVAELAPLPPSPSSSDELNLDLDSFGGHPLEAIAELLAKVVLFRSNAPCVRLELIRPRALLTAESLGVDIFRTRADYTAPADTDPSVSIEALTLDPSSPNLAHDKLFVRGLRRFIIIGINACERLEEQEVIVDLDFLANQEVFMVAHRLKNGARREWRAWRQVVKKVEEPLTIEHITTSLAQLIVTPPTCSTTSLPLSWNVPRTSVRVSKPSALMFAKYPSVQVTRDRKDFFDANGALRASSARGLTTDAWSAGTSATAESSSSQSTAATEIVEEGGEPHRVVLGVGTNMGQRVHNISEALKELGVIGSQNGHKTRVVGTSFLYESEAMYVEEQAKFLNAAVEIETTLEPLPLLHALKSVEDRLGRQKTIRNGPRIIDLDVLFYDDLVFDSRQTTTTVVTPEDRWLQIPHASIAEREFVLRPLVDLNPHFRHPKMGQTTSGLLYALSIGPSTLKRVMPLSASLAPTLPLRRTWVMSIINTTPDSFSDGGDNVDLEASVATALGHLAAGADILDIGGMSTRPGAADVTPEEEEARVVPLIKALRERGVTNPLSIDTFRPSVAKAAVIAGADIINDVMGGASEGMLEVMAAADVPVVLMHSRGTPATMSKMTDYEAGDVVAGVRRELAQRIQEALDAGVKRWNIIVDPGIGFAKTGADNLALLRRLPEVLGRQEVGDSAEYDDHDSTLLRQFPSLVGLSRKRFIGTLTGKDVAKDRVLGTAAGVTASIAGGAEIVRVHDVEAMVDVAKHAREAPVPFREWPIASICFDVTRRPVPWALGGLVRFASPSPLVPSAPSLRPFPLWLLGLQITSSDWTELLSKELCIHQHRQLLDPTSKSSTPHVIREQTTGIMVAAEPVSLYVYDLSNGMAKQWGRMLTGRDVEGIWHTSLVLHGMEVFYGQGIDIVSPPGTTHHGRPVKQLSMGSTQIDRDTFLEYIQGMREVYSADRYHLLDFNCNTFTNDVLGFLNGNQIPEDIRNLPSEIMSTPFGRNMRPMIDQMFRGGNARPDASNAVQSLLPPTTGSNSSTATPSQQSMGSNLQICTSPASMQTALSENPAVAVMFTSNSCPPCNAVKPYFEELARTHGAGPKRIVFVLVEMGLGGGAQVASDPAFGGPIRATPTFVFFARGEKLGQCQGADRQELKTQVQLLEMEVYPAHAHTKLSLPAFTKLSKSLAPVTYPSFPPLPVLAKKLDASLNNHQDKIDSTTRDVLTKRVIAYLAALPAPPVAPTTPLPADAWIPATEKALEALAPQEWFPLLDTYRIALARDISRLSASTAFTSLIPRLLERTCTDLESSEKALILTLVRLVSNMLPSPTLVNLLLERSSFDTVTRIIVRALLDPDQSVRSAGSGLAWSIISRVYDRRVGLASIDADEEWQVEMASALFEALSKEEESVEVVHRLAATLGLLMFQSSHADPVKELLGVLGLEEVVNGKAKLLEGNAEVAQLFKELDVLCQS
ncbi:BQ5605_C008g05049 [Microbotryum silenes-dioicae]|uniref:Folic acid synthesis protein FOL1 n=1 Tax=Microbotryum silenes-dioicae TaxID=796604 RepID=A0A2X0PDP6_9BASI|nr:BQ5605_C008g05049 [Microbotryum silenes-dioicae]